MLPDRLPRVPPPQPRLTPEERKRRRNQTPNTRLTPKLTADYCRYLRGGYPPYLAGQAVGINRQTIGDWHAVAVQALRLPWQERTQFQRAAIDFHQAVDRAVGEAATRIHRAVATAGGVIDAPPQIVTTTTTKLDAEGNVVEQTIVERTLPSDWRAAAHVGKYRFPDEFGGITAIGPEEIETGPDLSPAAIVSLIASVKRQRAELGRTNGQVIDTTSE